MTTRPGSTSSFVTEVLATAGRLEKEDLNAKLSKLSRRIDEVKVEVHESLQKKYIDFYPNLNASLELSGRVKDLSENMTEVTTKIEQELKTQLNESTVEFQDLTTQVEETKLILGVLDKLTKINDALRCVDEALKCNEFTKATQSLETVKELLDKSTYENESDILILKVLHNNYSIQKQKLIYDIGQAWSTSVKWTLPDQNADDNGQNSTSSLQILSQEGTKEVLKNILQALYDLDLLDIQLKKFGQKFLKHFVKPIIWYEDIRVDTDSSLNSETLTVIINNSAKKAPVPTANLFHKLKSIFEFLHNHLTSLNIKEKENDERQMPLMRIFGNLTSDEFIELLIQDCLRHSIPSNSTELLSYKETIKMTELYQEHLLKLKFLASDETPLTDFVGNVNILFANKKCKEILEEARSLLTSDIHNMVQIKADTPFGDLPQLGLEGSSAKKAKTLENITISCKPKISANTFKLPTCKISSSVQKLMELAYQTLDEATQSQGAVQMFYAVRNMFELFIDVVPTYHKDSLASLPQLSALHHNNCMFIAHHLLTLGHQFRPNFPEPLKSGSATFIDLVPKLRRMAAESFLEQLTSQRTQLIDCLGAAQGFVSVSEDDNFGKAERSLKQILYQLQRLSTLWRDVLSCSIYYEAIGALYNSVITGIISNITSLEDISADDANQLHSLLVLLSTKAPEFFEIEEGQNTKVVLHKNVGNWNKVNELALLLNGGLQDIADRWAEGKGPLAIEFNANEVKQLIRALFQNTDRRAAVLAKIR